MRARQPWGIALLLLLAASVDSAVGADTNPKPTIKGLAARIEDDRAMVSFRVADGLSPEALERIRSGIPVTFRHRVELLARRSFPLPPKTIARTVIETRAAYDPLTRRYSLERTLTFRGRHKKNAPPPRRESHVTDVTEEVRVWMTELYGIGVFDPGFDLDEYKLKVRVDSLLGRRYILLIFPDRISASAELRLEP